MLGNSDIGVPWNNPLKLIPQLIPHLIPQNRRRRRRRRRRPKVNPNGLGLVGLFVGLTCVGLGLGLGLGLFRGERLRIEGRTRPATSRESTLRRRSFISAPAHSSSCLHRAVGSWCEVVMGGRLPICSQPRWLVRALALPQAGTGGEKPASSKSRCVGVDVGAPTSSRRRQRALRWCFKPRSNERP